jgi:hypothetical protein
MADAQGRRAFGYNYSSYAANSTTEFRRFGSEYFAGADIRIYFGDIWIDEITSLQFTLQEQVAPIFGYASYTWDKVARGSRYISGSFSINFKESYYLQQTLNRLTSTVKTETASGFTEKQWKSGVDIEALMESADTGNFDKIADDFEKSLWGAVKMDDYKKAMDKSHQNSYFYPEFRKEDDAKGNPQYDNNSQKVLTDSGFNIIISYGPMNEANGMNTPETTHTLVNVQLTGVSQVIGGDGNPVQEQYTFIAKDLDGNVTLRY